MGRRTVKNPKKVAERVSKGDFLDEDSRLINGMTDLQLKTCNEFVRNGGNMSKAVRKHHAVTGRTSVHTTASRYLRDDICLAYIKRRIAEEGVPSTIVGRLKSALDAEIVYNGVSTGLPDHRIRMDAAMRLLSVLEKPFRHLGQGQDSPSTEIGNIYVELADTEPVEILQWMMENKGRMPTPAERQKILTSSETSSTPSKNGNGFGK